MASNEEEYYDVTSEDRDNISSLLDDTKIDRETLLSKQLSVLIDPLNGYHGPERFAMPGSDVGTTVVSYSTSSSYSVPTGVKKVVFYMSPEACEQNGRLSIMAYGLDAAGVLQDVRAYPFGTVFTEFAGVSLISAGVQLDNASSINNAGGTLSCGVYRTREVDPASMTTNELENASVLRGDTTIGVKSRDDNEGVVVLWRDPTLGRVLTSGKAHSAQSVSLNAERRDMYRFASPRYDINTGTLIPIADHQLTSGAVSSLVGVNVDITVAGSNGTGYVFDSLLATSVPFPKYVTRFVLDYRIPITAVGIPVSPFAAGLTFSGTVQAVMEATIYGPASGGTAYSEVVRATTMMRLLSDASNTGTEVFGGVLNFENVLLAFSAGRCEPISRVTISVKLMMGGVDLANVAFAGLSNIFLELTSSAVALSAYGAGNYDDRKLFLVVNGVADSDSIQLKAGASIAVLPKSSNAPYLRHDSDVVLHDPGASASMAILAQTMRASYRISDYKLTIPTLSSNVMIDSLSGGSEAASQRDIANAAVSVAKYASPELEDLSDSVLPGSGKFVHKGIKALSKFMKHKNKKQKSKKHHRINDN
jgi:hypothetical protein